MGRGGCGARRARRYPTRFRFTVTEETAPRSKTPALVHRPPLPAGCLRNGGGIDDFDRPAGPLEDPLERRKLGRFKRGRWRSMARRAQDRPAWLGPFFLGYAD